MEGSFDRRKGSAKWASAVEKLSILEVVVGALLLLLSMRYLYQFTSFTGQFLGALMVFAGLVGYLGGHIKNANIVNLQLIVSIIGILLAFQFIGEVKRDTQIDCALAELYQQGKAIAKLAASVRQSDTMQAVFSRLNEMEDMLTLAQHSAVKQVELKQEQEKLRYTDLNYIQAKVEMIQRHAEEVLNSVLNNPNITAETIVVMTEENKDKLRKRLDIADKVLERVRKHHQSGNPDEEISYQEYEQILHALTDPEHVTDKASHPELQSAKSELANMRAAMDRAKADQYESLQVGETHQHLRQIDEYRQKRREEFTQEFERHLQQMQAAHAGSDYLADLPEHCVRETTGEKVMVLLGVAMVLLQLLAAYMALSLSFRLPVKGE
ncbi:hypothetical protein N2152v2_004893 [Parachlorella kessleri]